MLISMSSSSFFNPCVVLVFPKFHLTLKVLTLRIVPPLILDTSNIEFIWVSSSSISKFLLKSSQLPLWIVADYEVVAVIVVLFKSKISKFFVTITLSYSYDCTAGLIVPSDSLLYLRTTGMQSERQETQDIKQIQMMSPTPSGWEGNPEESKGLEFSSFNFHQLCFCLIYSIPTHFICVYWQ